MTPGLDRCLHVTVPREAPEPPFDARDRAAGHDHPVPAPPTAPDIAAEFRPFTPDAEPPVPWADVLPAFLTAYPPGHPDHLEGGETLVDQYLVPYTRGARLGPLLCSASAIAVRAGRAYGGGGD